ncbi:alpha/beta hydrolase family protein, partial [Streptomyces galbus]|nr:hypothetical protein [Streptomyces galbus]
MTTPEPARTATGDDLSALPAVPPPVPVVSVKPMVLPFPSRGTDLHVRVSAPVTGQDLPVVLFAHGFGSDLDGYAPLTDHWAAHGCVVVQATHLDSRRLGLAADDPRRPHVWRYRVEDLKRVLDDLDVLEAAVPGLAGRLDRDRVAVAGHSFGGQTAAILLGLRVTDPRTGTAEDLSDPRVTAGGAWCPGGKTATGTPGVAGRMDRAQYRNNGGGGDVVGGARGGGRGGGRPARQSASSRAASRSSTVSVAAIPKA